MLCTKDIHLVGCVNSKKAKAESPATAQDPTVPLTEVEIQKRTECPDANEIITFNEISMNFSWLSQRGYYPNAPTKENQDSYSILPRFGHPDQEQAFFAIYDGHGKDGHYCSRFARDHLPELLREMLNQSGTSTAVMESIRQAHLHTNAMLHKNMSVDDSLSGTTAISVLFRGRTIYVANVGDSRAVLVSRGEDGKLVTKALSSDQTPYRLDERERVKRAGARVLSMDQIEGLEPVHENWGDVGEGDEVDEGGDPPRIWSPLGNYPGTAFTRSIGDLYAEELGVIAEPEIIERNLRAEDLFVIIASDGVFEFMTNQMVAELAFSELANPLSACRAIVAQAYGLWLQYEVRTDDISIIIIQLTSVKGGAAGAAGSQPQRESTDLKLETSKPVRRVMSREKKRTMIQENFTSNSQLTEDMDEAIDLSHLMFEKSEEERSMIEHAIKNSFLFQHLNTVQRETVISVMQRVDVKEGTWVIRQGDQGDRLYIIDKGRFEVRVSGSPEDPTGGAVVHVYEPTPTFHPIFGELSLMYGKPRAASVIALENGVLWALDRKVFRNVVLRTVNMRRDIVRTLRSVEMLRSLNVHELQRLADLLSEVEHPAGTYIIRQGEMGDTFFVIMKGHCICTINGKDGEPDQTVMKLKDNDYFGERALLHSVQRAANVIAVTDVKLLYIGKSAFEEVLGPLANIIETDRIRREAAALESLRCPDSIEDVNLLGVVGSDPTGPLVVGALDNNAANVSLRVFVLSDVESCRSSAHVLNCIDAAHAVSASTESCPFLPKLLRNYHDSNAVYCLFNSPVVADLSAIARANSVILPETSVVYIAACVVVALEALHKIGIIYRSVQPETIHVDSSGRVVLMDYRISKLGAVGGRTYTICGAADYLAPEQITQQGHGEAVDLWSLGVMLYELSTGEHPFASSSEVAIFNKISSLGTPVMPTLPIPGQVSPNMKDMIASLVVHDPQERLGSPGKGGMSQLRQHPLFSGVEWNKIFNQPSPLAALATTAIQEATSMGITDDMRGHWKLEVDKPDWLSKAHLY